MLLLAATTDKFSLITSAAGSIDVHVSYVDASNSTLVPSGAGTRNTAITTATTTDILAAPAASTVRNAKTIQIRNKSASVANDVTVQFDQNATLFELHKVTLQPGEALEYVEGVGFFTLAAASSGFGDVLMRALDADQTGGNVSTAQNWFPTLGAVAVEASVVYEMEGLLNVTRAAGATSHTTGLLFAGTATLTYIAWDAVVGSTDAEANGNANKTSARVATNTQVKGTSTSATEAFSLRLTGMVKINAAGTLIPQFIYSAAPGGAPTIRTGSFFKLSKRGAAFSAKGTWT
jgi:hypothetical protein